MTRCALAVSSFLLTAVPIFGQDQPDMVIWPPPHNMCERYVVPPQTWAPPSPPAVSAPRPREPGPHVVGDEQRLWQLMAQTEELTQRAELLSRKYDALAWELHVRRLREQERAEREVLRRYRMKARGAYSPGDD